MICPESGGYNTASRNKIGTNPAMSTALSPSEEAQLMQTIEMFEVITQSQPSDHQSLEILKEAYLKLGRQKDVVFTAKRIAQAYVQMGQISSAILEYESVLQLFPDDPDVKTALAEIEDQASNFSAPTAPSEGEAVRTEEEVPAIDQAQPAHPAVIADVDDGRVAMKKIFVDGRVISDVDFNALWPTQDPNSVPSKAEDPFLQLLADQNFSPWENSLKLISEKSRLGYMPIDRYDIDVDLARSFSKDVCRRWCVLPFDRMSKSVLVATTNPFNKQAIRELEHGKSFRFLWYLTNPAELVRAINKVYR